jgi:AcrR family transcriptional regulator
VTRTAGSKGENTLKALRAAGLKRLYQQGFSGTTLRELAKDVGIQAGSLYNYFHNKQDFLFQLMKFVMNNLMQDTSDRLEGVTDPKTALHIYVECHVTYHCARRKEVLISTTELRSLTPENYQIIVAMRDTHENRLREILSWGNTEKVWDVADEKIVTKLILGMMTSVGTWYRMDGQFDISSLVKIYQDMVDNLVYKSTLETHLQSV